MHTLTLVGDPNDGTHGLYMNGVLICDSRDEDATLNDLRLDFWRDALDAAITNLGGELVEETRYRPSRRESSHFGDVVEYESYWPEKLEDMGPVEPPYEPEDFTGVVKDAIESAPELF